MLNPDYRDMLSMLNEEGVEYLVVGAHALAAHGYPRSTGDIDLWIRCSEENAKRVWHALRRFGAPLQDLTVADLATPETVFQIGVVPRRIDVLTSITAVSFEEAWPHRKCIEADGFRLLTSGAKNFCGPSETPDVLKTGRMQSGLRHTRPKLTRSEYLKQNLHN